MTWLRLDDQFHRHRKVAPLSDAAFRLHVTVMLECSNQLTDGRIDCALVPTLPRAPRTLKRVTDELERAGLWHRDGDAWVVHDFLDWNPPAQDVLRKREAARERMRRARNSKPPPRNPEPTPERDRNQQVSSQDVRANTSRSSPNPVPVPVPVPDPKAAEADPRPPAGSDPTPSGVQQRQRHEESLEEPEVAERPSRPRNREQALQVPIRERAQVLVDEEHLESWLEPHRWPEVLELGERFAAALGWTRPRMTRASDARRLVHLLAAFDAAELDRAVEAAPGDDWLTTGRKGLGSLSVEVVSRLLAPKRVAKARSTRYPHRQPDYEGERTFSAADLFAGGDGYVIAGAGGGR